MKLIKRTYLSTIKWLIPALILGSVYCYFMIEYIEHEETDEFLTYEMERLVAYHDEHGDLPEFHKVADVIPDLKYDQPLFKDTMLLEPGDNEMVPYRELRFSIAHKEKHFTIVLRHLLLGHDDMIEGTLLIVIGLFIVFLLSILLSLRTITGKVWQPFYSTLRKLLNYNISAPVPHFEHSKIEEFDQLNTVIDTLLKKIASDFQTNKEFNENISHELQTHLAVIRVNAEKMLNEWTADNRNTAEIKKIHKTVTQLTQIQRSLSLLNKIENGEFNDKTDLDLKEILEQSVDTFSEIIDLKSLALHIHASSCHVSMDIGLAEILMNNLLKNAVKHNLEKGYITVRLNENALTVENSGLPFEGNPHQFIKRFSKGATGNTGIGLSIVRQICKRYNFTLDYIVKNKTTHILTVYFK